MEAEKYMEYDQFGNPLWIPSLEKTVTEEQERIKDIYNISNITSTYIKEAQEALRNQTTQAQILSSLVAIKDLKIDTSDGEVPTLSQIQEALELKQKLSLAQSEYVKKFQDGFYVNAKEGTIRYFDGDDLMYKETRKITPVPNKDLLIFPIEHKTVDGSYTIYTVNLPKPEKQDERNYIICHELIGYTEIPQMGVGVNEMDAQVIAFGSGKIPLGNVDHYERWCTSAQKIFRNTGTIPDFNDFMQNNTTTIRYDPYKPGSYTPLIPCKGVFSRQVIRKKPKYSSEFRNESIFQTFTGTGHTYNVRDPHTGIGIICYEDMINIVGAHRQYSQDDAYEAKAQITKIYLILREVKVEKEDQTQDWGNVWDLVLEEQLKSDVTYTGSVTLGPNFNPRPENVQIMNMPVDIQDPIPLPGTQGTHRLDETIAPSHMTTVETVRELHPLPPDTLMDGLQEGIPPDPLEHSSSTPTDTTPLENESIIQWAQRLGYLSKFDAPALGSMFNDVTNFHRHNVQDSNILRSTTN